MLEHRHQVAAESLVVAAWKIFLGRSVGSAVVTAHTAALGHEIGRRVGESLEDGVGANLVNHAHDAYLRPVAIPVVAAVGIHKAFHLGACPLAVIVAVVNHVMLLAVGERGVVTAADVIADEQLKDITAVKNGAVYNMPTGFEAWDSPVPSGVLGMLWMTAKLHPKVYSMDEFAADATDFYKTFYGFDMDTSSIFAETAEKAA